MPKISEYIDRLKNKDISLKVIDLSRQDIGNEEISELASCLKGSHASTIKMSKSSIALAAHLQGTRVTKLELSNVDIGIEDIRNLAQHLKNSPVTSLDFSMSQIDDEGIEILAPCLRDTNIIILNLYCNNISVVGISVLARHLVGTKVDTLILSFNGIFDEGIEVLAPYLKDTNITELDLSRNSIGDEGIGVLAHYLKDTNITELDLSQNSIGDEGLGALAPYLKYANLTSLYLSFNNITDEGIVAFAPYLPQTNITELKIAQYNLNDKKNVYVKDYSIIDHIITINGEISHLLQLVGEYVKSHQYKDAIIALDKVVELRPENVNAWFQKAKIHLKLHQPKQALIAFEKVFKSDYEHNAVLTIDTILDFSNCKCDDFDLSIISKILINHSNIMELDLHYNQFGLEGLKTIAPVLMNIKVLNISDNCIDSDGLQMLLRYLFKIKTLDVSYNPINLNAPSVLRDILAKNSLRTLNLAYCKINNHGLSKLTGMLQENVNLNSLNLRGNKFDLEDLFRFCQVLPSTMLRALDLSCMKIGNSGMTGIIEYLRYSQVEVLKFNYCNLSDTDLIAIAKRLNQTAIATLEITGNDFTDEGLRVFSAYVAENQQIIAITLPRKIDPDIKKRIDVTIERNRETRALEQACHHAAQSGEISKVDKCIAKGINLLSKTGEEKNTLLHWAAQAGHVEGVVLLMEAFKSRQINPMIKNANGKTPLDLAKEAHHSAAVIEALDLATATRQRSLLLYEAGDYHAAMLAIEEALSYEPQHQASLELLELIRQNLVAKAYFVNGLDCIQKGAFAEAIQYFDNAAKLSKHFSLTSKIMEKQSEAEKSYQLVQAQQHYVAACQAIEQKKYLLAQSELGQATRLDPTHQLSQALFSEVNIKVFATKLMMQVVDQCVQQAKNIIDGDVNIADQEKLRMIITEYLIQNHLQESNDLLSDDALAKQFVDTLCKEFNTAKLLTFSSIPKPTININYAGFKPVYIDRALNGVFVAMSYPKTIPLAADLEDMIRANNIERLSSKDFKKMTPLGAGGYGQVYKSIWHGQEVAVKQLYLTMLPDELLIEFCKEAVTMARLNSTYVVRLCGVCIEENKYSLVMEYMALGNLSTVLRNEVFALPWSMRLSMALNLSRGLQYLHHRNIIHRDLKSLNILVDKQFNVKIADFGLSKIKKTTTAKQSHVKGSVPWMAPELFAVDREATFASDVYSLGVVLWEILSRKFPFDHADVFQIMFAIEKGKREEMIDDPSCPKNYQTLIENCWKQTASDRPTSKAVVKTLKTINKQYESSRSNKWDISSQNDTNSIVPCKNYCYGEPSERDIEFVRQCYEHHPLPGKHIAKVTVLFSNQDKSFQAKLPSLNVRAQKAKNEGVFKPKWYSESRAEWRHQVNDRFMTMTEDFCDNDYPDVKFFPGWHGTSRQIIPSILESGFVNLALNDPGFYGKGLYFANEANYAMFYTLLSGDVDVLLLNWVACASPYPVIHGDSDIDKKTGLYAKPVHANHDAHFIPVSRPRYAPCPTPDTVPDAHELVVFESSQCLPRYIVEFQSDSLPKPLSLFKPKAPKLKKSAPVDKAETKTSVSSDKEEVKDEVLFSFASK